MSITMTDGKNVQTIGEHEIVRRGILEAMGWREGKPEAQPEVQSEPVSDGRDLEDQMLDGAEALAPKAVKAAKEKKRTRKPAAKGNLPTP